MERRRLAVLCSHLRSPGWRPKAGDALPVLSPSGCHASGSGAVRPVTDAMRERCVFCLIVRGESPAFKLYEDDVCLCILDSNPLCSGHSLIIPKLHFTSLQATPPSVVAAMCSSVPFLTNAIMKATQCGVLRKASKYDAFSERLTECYKLKMCSTFSVMENSNLKAGDQLWPSEGVRRQPINKDPETFSLVSRIKERISSLPNATCCTEESDLHKNLHD